MSICKIEHPKTKNAYKSSIAPLTKAFDSNEKYFNDKFKKYYKYKQDIIGGLMCANHGTRFAQVCTVCSMQTKKPF